VLDGSSVLARLRIASHSPKNGVHGLCNIKTLRAIMCGFCLCYEGKNRVATYGSCHNVVANPCNWSQAVVLSTGRLNRAHTINGVEFRGGCWGTNCPRFDGRRDGTGPATQTKNGAILTNPRKLGRTILTSVRKCDWAFMPIRVNIRIGTRTRPVLLFWLMFILLVYIRYVWLKTP